MKVFLLGLVFSMGVVFAGSRSLPEIFSPIYGKMTGSCQRKQLATTGDNRTTALTPNTTYLVSCDDNSGAGVACACTQGGSSVSVSKTTAFVLKAGLEYPLFVDSTSNAYLSCQSYASTPYVALCPMNP